MRHDSSVRPAGVGDIDPVAALCLRGREESQLGSTLCSPDVEELRLQLGVLLSTSDGHLLVAVHGEQLIGMVIARSVGPNPVSGEHALFLDALYVDSRHRRRGVGHHLMQAACDLAARLGIEQLYALPTPGSRGMQRFLARLGFAPAAAHRVVSTAALQRRLSGEQTGHARSGRLEELIARRRLARVHGVIVPGTVAGDGEVAAPPAAAHG